ncbi:MAG: 2Fe-2S iron-sulfur cluster binding domain-containing protein [Myxococcales bacterium]|nr:2Fe-2S iron-sulfur cluster binding domain-containing protein [Myxococcales bacterium]
MPKLLCGGKAVELGPTETVLEGLLRAGLTVAHSCRAGACQSCLVRATEGLVPSEAQVGLKDTQKAEGYFLACSARPKTDLAVSLPDQAEGLTPAHITHVAWLAESVLRVELAPTKTFAYRAGQFVNVVRADGLTRSYSLANLPGDGPTLTLHVRVVSQGRMSTWLASPGALGALVNLRGPAGSCFYVEGRPTQPLLLVGTGTGLAPLYGILRDALRAGHSGPIRLFHGARTPRGLYLQDELRALASTHPQVSYTACVREGAGEAGVTVGALDELAMSAGAAKDQRVFLCGDPTLVTALRKRAFLAGARLRDIYSDPFILAPPPGPSTEAA